MSQGQVKEPNYLTGKRGRQWTQSLRRAAANGYEIIGPGGVKVTYNNPRPGRYCGRAWVDKRGNRYDSRDCSPRLPEYRNGSTCQPDCADHAH